MSDTEHFYAASPLRSGIFHFDSEEARAAWIAEHDGFAVAAGRVDPDIRAEFGDS